MLKEWYKIYFTLVHRVIILIRRSHRLPHSSRDQTVAEPHPDALPDGHLDLVVILKTLSLSFTAHILCVSAVSAHYRVWRGEDSVKLLEELSVHQLRLLQVILLELRVGGLRQDLGVGQLLQTLEWPWHEWVILLTVWQKCKKVWSLIGGKDTHEDKELRNASLLTSLSPKSDSAPNP